MDDKSLQEFFNELYNDFIKTNDSDIELPKIKVPPPPPIPQSHVFPPLPPLVQPPIPPPPVFQQLSPATIDSNAKKNYYYSTKNYTKKNTLFKKECIFFNKGYCKFDNKCNFKHTIQCEHFNKGTCKFGKWCKNYHKIILIPNNKYKN